MTDARISKNGKGKDATWTVSYTLMCAARVVPASSALDFLILLTFTSTSVGKLSETVKREG